MKVDHQHVYFYKTGEVECASGWRDGRIYIGFYKNDKKHGTDQETCVGEEKMCRNQ